MNYGMNNGQELDLMILGELHGLEGGHSLVLAGDYLLMFGGRGNEAQLEHVPRTYNVERLNGTIQFTTYEDKPVIACHDLANEYFTKEEQEAIGCTSNSTTVTVGLFYNDVWAYNLKCTRYFDGPCEGSGWTIWHPGALEGGCNIQLGIEVCNVPSERWNHGAVYFSDETMYIYGGFSQRCADFCDDMWMFDLGMRTWREVYPAGQLSALDGFLDEYGNGGPGKRWKFSMVNDDEIVAIFGGFRLWHGFAAENSEENDWSDYSSLPPGGYLDDFWFYEKILDTTTVTGADFKTSEGSWTKILPKEECYEDPGISWESRDDVTCTVTWPPNRAGHGSVLDLQRGLFWIFGGYRTYYPYLSTDQFGASTGSNIGSGGFVPYPQYLYFLNDMWYYNMSDGLWTEIEVPEGDPKPEARMDMVMLLTEQVIFMHGGYADNYLYDDVWYFDLETHKWLEKERFVYPKYPDTCTDDFEYIVENNCTALEWPKHLERDHQYPYDILPFPEQPFYYPDSDVGPYWAVFDKGEAPLPGEIDWEDMPPHGTPMAPYSASGPLQFVRSFSYSFNYTHNATLLESCTSVWSEPNRDKTTDGLYGRANHSVFIAQPRRQRPGWDGCRDRADGDLVLPQELQYVKPFARSGHKGVYVNGSNEIIIYGGRAYLEEQPKTHRDTWEYKVADDMWYFNFDVCINNCSFQGDCYLGFCFCYVGYYGIDCSNISCPGTFCYYDEDSHEQVCQHACQAGYNHTDDDVYLPDMRKTPCTRENPGESNGICDGFGNAYCAPPFITEDCSIKDCKNNCSFNGYCSVEYPVSRCNCNPGYIGEYCQEKICLNNCSYPNGLCNHTSGECNCRMMYDPYNNSREYKPWGGEDCSYLFAYAAGPKSHSVNVYLLVFVVAFSVVAQYYVTEESEGNIRTCCDYNDTAYVQERSSSAIHMRRRIHLSSDD
eukprot:CAMPEP_0185022774 /NCGR_PEP_ID=MMETSP1103-20130426/5476_1 /TAXON_ID=36769 /ORGANISM="Paraphysomonas bandaiensis, Strain Caron Lab Isolate" /LENGTH=939 /DNA_ID=CAMNT_0027554999 /DNA_START=122 /DNA_END=2940 /DNA_ORIENTATION=-